MTIHKNFLAVSYSEFQRLYNFGEITAVTTRLAAIPLDDEGNPKDEIYHSLILLGRAPAYDPNDEEAILLLGLSRIDAQHRPESEDPCLITIPIETVDTVVPLGDRSYRILDGRLREMGLKLSKPYFAESAKVHRFEMITISSLKAGSRLAELLLGENSAPLPALTNLALKAAIYHAEYPDDPHSVSPTFQKIESVLPTVFTYTRHEPSHNLETDCVEDLGICLGKFYGKQSPVVSEYREAFVTIRDTARVPSCSTSKALNQESFRDSLTKINEQHPENFPFHPVSMITFLKWKDQFHRAGDKLDLPQLHRECAELVASLGAQHQCESLWLLGSYVGHDRMATLFYSTTTQAVPIYNGVLTELQPIKIDKIGLAETGAAKDAAPGNDEVVDQALASIGTDQDKRVNKSEVDTPLPDPAPHDEKEVPAKDSEASLESLREQELATKTQLDSTLEKDADKMSVSTETAEQHHSNLTVQGESNGPRLIESSPEPETASKTQEDGSTSKKKRAAKGKAPAKASRPNETVEKSMTKSDIQDSGTLNMFPAELEQGGESETPLVDSDKKSVIENDKKPQPVAKPKKSSAKKLSSRKSTK
jgi:hypothetical protein